MLGQDVAVASTLDGTSASGTLPSGALHPVAASRLRRTPGHPDKVAVGTIVWLASELMFFAALFAAYFTLRNVTNSVAGQTNADTSMWEWGASHFNMPVAVANTALLVLSSVTCQMGVHAAENSKVSRSGSIFNPLSWGLREWYVLTFVLGAVFIGGQAFEYATLIGEGFVPSTNSYTSAFFLATGFHGLHVIGGLVAFLLVLGRTFMAKKFTHEQAVNAVATSYYWHFVNLVWIVLFAVIYFVR